MRPLHQVVTRTPGVRRGTAVFAGTKVPIKQLMEFLDRGGSIEDFVQRHRDVTREVALAACVLGLEALIDIAPVEAPVSQASLLPRLDADGVIINAEELGARQVVGRRVSCPACRALTFKSWPEGWDGHAATRCRGIRSREPAARKVEYKRRFESLFL